jgi:hypothetical protein
MNGRTTRPVVLVTLLAFLVLPGPVEPAGGIALASNRQVPARTWVVNNTYDEGGTCTEDFCSLRQALEVANSDRESDTIIFGIPTDDPGYNPRTGKWTITLNEPLPTLSGSDSLAVDATYGKPGECLSYVVIDASNVSYGLDITGSGKTWSGFVIKNAQSHGVYIHGTGAQDNELTCSYVVSSTLDGVRIADGATGNSIGSASASLPNVIAFNGDDGIEITNSASDNTVVNNRIGTNEAGTAAWANGGYGVRISGGAMTNTIGLAARGDPLIGSGPGANLVSGNALGGILISGDGARDNVVQNNRVGTDSAGTAAIANQQDGVVISGAPDNVVGPGNLISGHTCDGVRIEGGPATGNVVKGNYIGTDADGETRVSNQRFGVLLQNESSGSTIGGDSAADGNLISGNGYDGDYAVYGGVGILGSNSNVLRNNRIGTTADGGDALSNARHGVMLSNFAQDNAIGQGTALQYANTIAWNEGDGVYVQGEGTVRNTIGRNSIHDNDDLGIDTESGGNEELPPPVIENYSASGSGSASLEATACPGCTILVYSDDDGEGRYYEGSGTADAGTGRFDWSGTPTGAAFTLVATDADGNTSEFSAALARLKLSIDDALPNVVVNKAAGDADSPAGSTIVEVVAEIASWDPSLKDDMDVVVTVPGDVFGSPVRVFVRDQVGDSDGPTTSWTNLGSGSYRADDVDLLSAGSLFRRRVALRFKIPNATLPQKVYIQGQIQVPGRTIRQPDDVATVRVVKPGSLQAIIVANRRLLYQNYTDSDVTSLLNRLYTEAQGPLASHSPLAAIYYVDAYSTQARNWNNTTVSYASEAAANTVADAIDDLIEDWQEDATFKIHISILGSDLAIAWPTYLLIVGDDDTVPFYRYNDPSDDEGVDLFDCDGNPANGKEHAGWCVDSNTNPAIRATDADYFFTDNPYADRWGTDWQTGDVELWTGRLLGESAADMLSLLAEGVSWNNGQRGNVVMASVDGWELGLEPHTSGTDHVADLYDVPSLLRGKGFQVRNDDIPTSEVRTIDVKTPYEGGDTSWNTNFRNAANNAGGMDLFFIGGHDSYDRAEIPGDDFSPDDTCAAATCRYNRFDDDHPIAMIVGCHGGLPVPDVDVDGGVDDDMVYDLVHEGASAYVGATGFSYGSPCNSSTTSSCMHRCTWGERLIQRFFGQLLKPPGGNGMAIGKAMAEAKRDYVFGHGSSDALDRKTVTEFNLYGVPWAFVYYPTPTTATGLAAAVPEARAFTATGGPVVAAAQLGVYSRNFVFDLAGYDTEVKTVGGIAYDLLSVEGGDLAIADGVPILPYVRAYTLTLPTGSSVTDVQIVDSASSPIGIYNVPIAQVGPWTEGGLTYTTTTDIEYPYPADLVQWQEIGTGVLFTVFPIQHNPATGATTFYNYLEVQVTYDASAPIAVVGFSTDKASYRPGDAIHTGATIWNVGDAEAMLIATLAVEDELGHAVASHTGDPFVVPAGGTHELPLSPIGPLDAGSYQATLTMSSAGDPVGGDSAGFQVVDGRISTLSVPEILVPGQEASFEVTFANYREGAVIAEVGLSIHDGQGLSVADLPPQAIPIGADSEGTVGFAWNSEGACGGSYSAIAMVSVEGESYGPAQQGFQIGGRIYLPLVVKNGP